MEKLGIWGWHLLVWFGENREGRVFCMEVGLAVRN